MRAPAVESRQVDDQLPLLALGLVIVSWGTGPVVTKLITTHPVIGVVIRFALSIPVLMALLVWRGQRLDREILRRTAAPGIAFGINLIFVFFTLQEATVAVLSVSIALQPTLLLFVAGPLFGERPTVKHVLWTLVGVAGATAVILGAGSELRTSALGLIYACTALATFSTYFVLTRLARSNSDVDPVRWMTGVNIWSLLAALVPAPFLVGRAELAEVDWRDLLWLVVLAYLTGVFGHVLMSWVHGYLEAARSALYLLSMNVVAVGLAWPVHQEPVTIRQVLGGLVVLGAASMVIRLPARVDPTEWEPSPDPAP